ncbi:MAG: glutamine synthetase, partial [Lachnospiraceae bacterium]|nr:glutamine synthetase [Lachnospiraceae bacterium]
AKLSGLPTSLDEALDALLADHDYLTAGGVFPERLLTQLVGRCRKASERISRLPHPAEFAEYYDL